MDWFQKHIEEENIPVVIHTEEQYQEIFQENLILKKQVAEMKKTIDHIYGNDGESVD